MKTSKLKAVNAKQEEFEGLYREVVQDFSDFEKQVREINFQNKQTEDTVEFIEKLLLLLENSEDEQLIDYAGELETSLTQIKNSSEERQETVKIYNETFERAENFMELFKEDLSVNSETGEVVLGKGALMLLEYMHTVRKTLQTEEEQQNKQ